MKSLLVALSLFTVAPVRSQPVERAAAALRWLPVIGLALGALAAVPAVTIWPDDPLLGAAVTVTLLAVLTRGLHLDGLADLADGLGSRRPADGALAVMRQSDIGPFGVATLVMVLLLDVAALTAVFADHTRWAAWAICAVSTATGRVAVLAAAAFPSARPDGFGALVAGSASLGMRAVAGLGVITLAAVIGWRVAVAVVVGLLVGAVVARHAVRRLGGTTGDVFGALIEVVTAATLLAVTAL